jgi:hypothetical protein
VSDQIRLVAALLQGALRLGAVRRLGRHLAAYLVCLVLLLIAFGFLIATLYLGLAMVMRPPLATLATAAILIAVGVAVVLIARRRPRRAPPGTPLEAEALLVGELVRRHPWSAVAIALALGALSGRSSSASSSSTSSGPKS